MDILASISDTAFAAWVRESGSLFAYPMFILLHTVGLAILVGLSSIVALLVIGAAPAAVLQATQPLFRYIWVGFGINAGSGLVLVMADAPTMAMNPIMWIKFVFIVTAVIVIGRLRRLVSPHPGVPPGVGARGKALAGATLACWVGAIVTGRLTAYFGPVAGLLVE